MRLQTTGAPCSFSVTQVYKHIFPAQLFQHLSFQVHNVNQVSPANLSEKWHIVNSREWSKIGKLPVTVQEVAQCDHAMPAMSGGRGCKCVNNDWDLFKLSDVVNKNNKRVRLLAHSRHPFGSHSHLYSTRFNTAAALDFFSQTVKPAGEKRASIFLHLLIISGLICVRSKTSQLPTFSKGPFKTTTKTTPPGGHPPVSLAPDPVNSRWSVVASHRPLQHSPPPDRWRRSPFFGKTTCSGRPRTKASVRWVFNWGDLHHPKNTQVGFFLVAAMEMSHVFFHLLQVVSSLMAEKVRQLIYSRWFFWAVASQEETNLFWAKCSQSEKELANLYL